MSPSQRDIYSLLPALHACSASSSRIPCPSGPSQRSCLQSISVTSVSVLVPCSGLEILSWGRSKGKCSDHFISFPFLMDQFYTVCCPMPEKVASCVLSNRWFLCMKGLSWTSYYVTAKEEVPPVFLDQSCHKFICLLQIFRGPTFDFVVLHYCFALLVSHHIFWCGCFYYHSV